MHPLRLACLLCWSALFAFQVSLLLPAFGVAIYWPALLTLPLLAPLPGLVMDRRYTYRWVGFLALPYFCIGISELLANPALRFYGLGTTLSSLLLFLSSIYYARYLGSRPPLGSAGEAE